MRKYYLGLDVHKLSIVIAVLNAHGKLITRTVIETTTESALVLSVRSYEVHPFDYRNWAFSRQYAEPRALSS